MTLVLKLDIDIIKMYHYIKNEISVCQGIQKLYPEQVDRHSDILTSGRSRISRWGGCQFTRVNRADYDAHLLSFLPYFI